MESRLTSHSMAAPVAPPCGKERYASQSPVSKASGASSSGAFAWGCPPRDAARSIDQVRRGGPIATRGPDQGVLAASRAPNRPSRQITQPTRTPPAAPAAPPSPATGPGRPAV